MQTLCLIVVTVFFTASVGLVDLCARLALAAESASGGPLLEKRP